MCDSLAELCQSNGGEARSTFNLTPSAVDFLKKALRYDRTKRASAKELLLHDLVRHFPDSVEAAPQIDEVCFCSAM